MTDATRETIAAYLDTLYVKHGRLTPALVVHAARQPQSPIHSHFEWDDGKAAAAWREDQARTLIRSVRITIRVDNVPLSTVRYLRDPAAADGEQGYRSIDSLLHDKAGAAQALRYELARALALLERARTIALALGLEDQVDDALAGITALHELAGARAEA